MTPEEWLEGTVVSIMNYGAFVRLEGDVDGMVHISQLDPHGERVDSVYNAVEVSKCLDSDGNPGRFTPSPRSCALFVRPSFSSLLLWRSDGRVLFCVGGVSEIPYAFRL